jgi:hypothetical protein
MSPTGEGARAAPGCDRVAKYTSDGFNGFSRFAFELEGEMLLSMTITA